MNRWQRISVVLGAALVVAGVSFFSWPAGLIVAGAALLTAGFTDFEG